MGASPVPERAALASLRKTRGGFRPRGSLVPFFIFVVCIQVISLVSVGFMMSYDCSAGFKFSQRHGIGADQFLTSHRHEAIHDARLAAHIDFTAGVDLEGHLDNYNSRNHTSHAPVLIVGGSDGSGTRAFVDILGRLGVPMLVDDEGTLDVHAKLIKGWPPLVKAVLDHTHAANYTVETIPEDLRDHFIQPNLRLLRKDFDFRAEILREYGSAAGHAMANGAGYGFKAPASMLLLPFMRKLYGNIKYLHVVRDGRDVALSANTSPVDKYYDMFFANATQRRIGAEKAVLAMQLWDLWNRQVHGWMQQNVDGLTFDYLVVRTEDLLDPKTRRQLLQQISDFVGAQRSPEELCCLDNLVSKGKSAAENKTPLDPAKIVKRRFLEFRGWVQNMAESYKRGREEGASFGQTSIGDASLYRESNAKYAERVDHHVGKRRLTVDVSADDRSKTAPSSHFKIESMLETSELQLIGRTLKSIPGASLRQRTRVALLSTPHHFVPTSVITKEHPDKLHKRYGRWVDTLRDDPELSALLHSAGRTGLQEFGYEPPVRFLDRHLLPVTCDSQFVAL